MPNVEWKGTSNQATRHRIRQIRWTQRERIGAVLMALLATVVALISAWLASNVRD